MTIRIRGRFPNYARAAAKVKSATEAATLRAAQEVVEDAKRRVPIRTGRLRNSISATVRDGKAEIGPTEFYGQFVELGTPRNPPQPFLIPAAEAVEPKFRDALQRLAENAVDD